MKSSHKKAAPSPMTRSEGGTDISHAPKFRSGAQTVKDMAYIAMFSILLAICSWITVPGPVPFTMQTFGIFCALELLGGKKGSAAILLYILLGAVGLPVFSGFSGGIGALFGTTGGYIIGFIFTGLIYWLLTSLFKKNVIVSAAAMLVGLAVCYAFGTAWFVTLYSQTKGSITVSAALGFCVIPFIMPDIIKLILALSLSKLLARRLRLHP